MPQFNEYRKNQGSYEEVFTDGSEMNERVEAEMVIDHYFQNGEATCYHLPKRLQDNSTIFVDI